MKILRFFKKKKKEENLFPNLSVKKLKLFMFLLHLETEILYEKILKEEIIRKDFQKH